MLSFSFTIFNQWGKEVYTFNSIGDRWDGRNKNGVKQPEGVYVYRVQATFNSGEMVDK